jgi:hypothetical protein
MNKLRVDLEEFVKVRRYLREINSVKLEDIEWVYKGKVREVPINEIEEWKFCGLSNTSFPDCVCVEEDGTVRLFLAENELTDGKKREPWIDEETREINIK